MDDKHPGSGLKRLANLQDKYHNCLLCILKTPSREDVKGSSTTATSSTHLLPSSRHPCIPNRIPGAGLELRCSRTTTPRLLVPFPVA